MKTTCIIGFDSAWTGKKGASWIDWNVLDGTTSDERGAGRRSQAYR
jgi:hypothetical protein